MLYTAVLILHISTALITGVVLVYSLYIVGRSQEDAYILCALIIGFVASLETFTGVVLAELSPMISPMSLSAHMLEYLGVCLCVEMLLYVRINKFSPLSLSA